jgi:D-lyxose ketol-isomerase
LKSQQVKRIRSRVRAFLKKGHITVTPHEAENIEVADFGLNDFKRMGLGLIVYENNDCYCAKELILFPRQTCPEHRHPPIDAGNRGKQETFRCRWGEVYLYVEGAPTASPKARIPAPYAGKFSVAHEVILRPGDQYTIPPDTLHWFQAGPKGAIVSEFSSRSLDESDLFTDPDVRRMPVYE